MGHHAVTWHHLGVTGQSLAVGQTAIGTVSTNEHPSNTGRPSGVGFTTLITGTERPDMALAIDTYKCFRDNLSNSGAFVSTATSGAGGTMYVGLKKGTATYTELMAQVTKFDTDSGGAGTVDGFHIIHGETDAWNGTGRDVYLGYLMEWQADYNTDAKAITAQVPNIHAFFSQPWESSMPTTSSEAMVLAHKQSALHHLVGPRYFLQRSDNVHLTAAGYQMLGRYHAKAQAAVLRGETWSPLLPSSIVRTGAVVVATFPTATPLQFDTTTVAAQASQGFAYTDTNGTATISSVAITGASSNEVTITLSAVPTGFGSRLRYAANGVGQQGNLRNSSATLPDWGCHFVEVVATSTPTPVDPPVVPPVVSPTGLTVRFAGVDRTVSSVRLGGVERTLT